VHHLLPWHELVLVGVHLAGKYLEKGDRGKEYKVGNAGTIKCPLDDDKRVQIAASSLVNSSALPEFPDTPVWEEKKTFFVFVQPTEINLNDSKNDPGSGKVPSDNFPGSQ